MGDGNPLEPREATLFRNNRSQAVRIPKEFELPGRKVLLRKEGERLIIEPVPKRDLIALLDSWDLLDEDLEPVDDLPLRDVNLD